MNDGSLLEPRLHKVTTHLWKGAYSISKPVVRATEDPAVYTGGEAVTITPTPVIMRVS